MINYSFAFAKIAWGLSALIFASNIKPGVFPVQWHVLWTSIVSVPLNVYYHLCIMGWILVSFSWITVFLKNKYYFPGAIARTKQVGIANEKLSLATCLYKHLITGYCSPWASRHPKISGWRSGMSYSVLREKLAEQAFRLIFWGDFTSSNSCISRKTLKLLMVTYAPCD